MSEMTWLDFFKRNKEIGKQTDEFWEYFWDLDIVQDNSKRTYLKRMAIDRVLNFVSRTVSTTEFKYTVGNKVSNELKHKTWMYKLNVKPNVNQNASDFWQKLVYKLLYDNEVLVILNDTEDLLIADSFNKTPYAVYPDSFSEVTVDDYTFARTFSRSEVWYMEYNNEDLENFIAGLYGDYGELFGRMIEVNMRNNQIRGVVDIDATKALKEVENKDGKTAAERLKNIVDKMFKSFKTDSVAIVAKMNGFDYNEVSSNSKGGNQSFDELKKIKNDFVSEVAGAVGVPPSLIFGDMAQTEEQTTFFLNFMIKPLINKIQTELILKLISKDDYMKGHRIRAIGPDVKNIIELATQIDKAIASGGFNKNEVRYEFGFDAVDGGDEFVLTKNYEKESKGGDDINDD
ncbi:phage portal protein [Vagococcus vulneris]|uniref:Phage portal protein n=2 Tax=Vagococcus vulneris TaxID=1977869 RepID=A0A429ZTI3_9ENTE|nr:phage portal protein [Vagococcus vulneris]